MPVKPPPLSLLRSSLLRSSRFSEHQMKLNPTRQRSGSTRFLARIFPFRLRYQGGLGHLASRDFSTRARSDSGSNRAPKSLVEDEAELSDWVSELRTGSYKAGVFTDDEGGSERRGNKRSRDEHDGDRGFRDLGRDRSGMKSGFRGSNLDRLGGRGRGGNVRRGSGDLGARNSRISRRFGSESEEDDHWDSQRKRGAVQGGMRGGRGGRAGRGGRIGGRGENRGREALLVSDDEGGGGYSRRGKSFTDLIGEDDSEETSDSDSGLLVSDEEASDSDSDSESDSESESDEIETVTRRSMFSGKGESVRPSSPSASGSYLSETRFDQCTISPLSLKAIKDAGYENMTVVQEATLPVILKGKDVMAKARTGTGKTVAFLLPSIEVVVKSTPADRDQKRPPILVLVICPTRELAGQAAAEANKLLKYHSSIGVQVVIGGTRLGVEQKRMQSNPCQILVATPGRLKDHIENTPGFATRLMGVKVLVLDEADHLLDMGFRKDIERIISAVPKQRQTLLFSATIPPEVRQVSNIALKRDHEYINTVQEGSEDTHSQVRQMHLVAPLEKHFPLLYATLKEHISDDVNYKVLVFCTTAMVTKLVAELLGELTLNVREIHSRKPQSYRTRVSDEFRKSKGLILVTSDVSARGVDYPDVTLVIQMGVPADRQQYIHRLGRTGRKGKEGQGILLLAPWEESFLSSIKDLPITKAPIPTVDPDVKRKVEKGLSHVDMKSKESAYQAWLGYYNSSKVVGRDKFRLVELANEFSRCMGLDTPPAIPKLVLGKMGLKNVPGLRSK